MKSICLIIPAVVALVFSSVAQDTGEESSGYIPASVSVSSENSAPETRLAIYAKLGYGFPMGGTALPEDNQHNAGIVFDASAATAIERDDKYLNFGKGLKIDLGAEIGLMKHVSAIAGLSITAGVPRLTLEYDNSASGGDKYKDTYKQFNIALKAVLLPSFTVFDLLDMYAGVGAGVFFNQLEYSSTASTVAHDAYIKTKPALGFLGQLGVIYPLTDMAAIVVDLSFDQVSFTSSERMILTNPNKIISKKDSESSYNSRDVEQPIEFPGTNIALRVGVRLSIL